MLIMTGELSATFMRYFRDVSSANSVIASTLAATS